MAVDSFSYPSEDVLQDLDPLSRALLDLSLHRGMEDAEIADVLGTDEDSVLEVRIGLLRALADKVAPEHADADLPELQAVVADRVYGDKDAEATEIAALEAAVPATEADERPSPRPRPSPSPPPTRSPLPPNPSPRSRPRWPPPKSRASAARPSSSCSPFSW